ncbi:MAG: hypothetical protein JO129_00525 [Candidatus Dependentiae bacterium]|nr:hypothetical protein [Candidatus Dependentiae bacterium]
MEFSKYIKDASNLLEKSDNSVTVFQGVAYSQIFFMQFFDRIKTELTIDLKTIDIQSGDFLFKSQLATSFLGMNCVYWLGDASMLKAKQKDDLLNYLADYQGPHKVIIFVDSKIEIPVSKHLTIVTIKDKYFFEDAKSLWTTQNIKDAQKNALFLNQIYKIKNSFTLDELFLLKNYQDLITADSKEFYESWVSRLVIPDTSLFTLSQLFFEKKEEAFFRLWLQIKPLYSEMFWISFWSDQLYRAYFFIIFTQEENFVAAKQASYGLSFSFMKQTYKYYKINELQSLHEALYSIDSSLKNGGNSYQIDQLYVDFFIGKFKS